MRTTLANVSVLSLGAGPALQRLVAAALRPAIADGLLLVQAAEDAASILRACREPFSSVLANASIVERHGLQVLDDLVGAAHAPAVLVLSRGRDPDLAARALQLGAQDVVPWSDVRYRLGDAVGRALARQHVVRELRSARGVLATAMLDHTTSALCRGALEFLVHREPGQRERLGREHGGLFVSVDDFAGLRSSLPHADGERVLRDVAVRLRTCARAGDHIARTGDAEFLVVLPDTANERALVLAEHMRAAVSAGPVLTAAGPVPVTVTLVAMAFDHTDGVAALCARGHAALGPSGSGGNRVIVESMAMPPSSAPHRSVDGAERQTSG